MKPLRTRLEEARKRFGIPWEVLERDYLLSWVLAGIGQVESLRKALVFKGGTAMKKCAIRQVAFDRPEAFFEPTMLAYVERTWANWLGPLVANLPPFGLVIEELRPQIESLVV